MVSACASGYVCVADIYFSFAAAFSTAVHAAFRRPDIGGRKTRVSVNKDRSRLRRAGKKLEAPPSRPLWILSLCLEAKK